MVATRFDAWTRRRFGAAAARALVGAVAGPCPLAGLARKKKRRGKDRKRPCEKLGTRCNPNNDKQLCCGVLYCMTVPELGGNRCCKTRFLACSRDADCCGNLVCAGEDGARSCQTEP